MANSFLARWLSLQWFIFVYFAFFCFFFHCFQWKFPVIPAWPHFEPLWPNITPLAQCKFFFHNILNASLPTALWPLASFHILCRLLSTSKSSTRCFELAKALHGRMMFFLVSEIPSCHPGGFFAQPVLSNSDPTTYILLKITFFSSSGESPRMTVNWERIWYCEIEMRKLQVPTYNPQYAQGYGPFPKLCLSIKSKEMIQYTPLCCRLVLSLPVDKVVPYITIIGFGSITFCVSKPRLFHQLFVQL